MTSSCPVSSHGIRAYLDNKKLSEATNSNITLESHCSMSDGVGRYAAFLKSPFKPQEHAGGFDTDYQCVTSMSSVRSGESQASGTDGIRLLRPADAAQEGEQAAAMSHSLVSESSGDFANLEQRLASLCEMPKQLSTVLDKVSKVLNLLQESERCTSAAQMPSMVAQMSLPNPRHPAAPAWRHSMCRPSVMEQMPLYGSPRVSHLGLLRPSGLSPPSARTSLASLCTVQSRASCMMHTFSGGSKDSGGTSPKHASSGHSAASGNSMFSSSTRGSSAQESLQLAACHATNAAREIANKYQLSYDADAPPKGSSRNRPFSTIGRASEASCASMISRKRNASSTAGTCGMASIKEKRTDESGNVIDYPSDSNSEEEEKQQDRPPKLNRRCYSLKGPSFEDIQGFMESHDADHFACMLHPGSGFRVSWDVLVIGCTVFLGVLIPLGLVYCNSCLRAPSIKVILFSVDIIFIFDVVLHFRTGFWLDGHMILNPWSIALYYVRSWFLIDLLSAWPLASAWSVEAGFWLWFPHCLKLLRLVRIPKLMSNLEKETRWLMLTPIRIGLLIPLALHVITCSWREVQRLDDMEELDTWPATYVQDAYWVIMTVTTVGYGDVSPKGMYTRIYAIFLMCISSVCFGATVSALTHMSKNFFNDEVEHRVAMAMNSMQERRVPLDLQHRVETNLRKILRQDHRGSALDPELLSLLSPALQRELLLSLLSATVLQFPLFNGAQRSFLAEIAQAHSWMQCSHYDLIVSAGQVIQDVFFVIHGTLSVRSAASGASPAETLARLNREEDGTFSETSISISPPGSPTAQATAGVSHGTRCDSVFDSEEPGGGGQMVDLQPTFRGAKEMQIEEGAWFGEACLFMEGVVSSSTIVAACEAELAVLAECDYTRIIQKYPRLLARHQKIGKAIRSGKLQLEELAYTRPDQDGDHSLSIGQGGFDRMSSGASKIVSLVRSLTTTTSHNISSWRVFPTASSASSAGIESGCLSVIAPPQQASS